MSDAKLKCRSCGGSGILEFVRDDWNVMRVCPYCYLEEHAERAHELVKALRDMARFYWGPGHHGYELMTAAADFIEEMSAAREAADE